MRERFAPGGKRPATVTLKMRQRLATLARKPEGVVMSATDKTNHALHRKGLVWTSEGPGKLSLRWHVSKTAVGLSPRLIVSPAAVAKALDETARSALEGDVWVIYHGPEDAPLELARGRTTADAWTLAVGYLIGRHHRDHHEGPPS